MSAGAARKTIPIVPLPPDPDDSDAVVSLYEARKKIYPRSVSGWFQSWRWILVWATQLVFYGLPWLQWNGRQAVLFDLEARRFYIFNLVLYPQDFIYLTALLVISALSLFLFTAVAGRLWCGYACPQTVYTEIFMWVERMVEGDRNARMRLDAGGTSVEKIARKTAKHFLWLAIALWTGFTFVGYFTPIQSLFAQAAALALGPWQTFWILFYGFATYGNAGWLREQVCKYMCPYARFQSAMFDRDTLIIGYDTKRGEQRGSRSRKIDYKAQGMGDCIDCKLCVHVCPTGIDIRDGLQYECIGCAACIDVCDSVMDKMDYPRGLIRYSTANAMDEHWRGLEVLKRILRPRVMIYSTILLALVVTLAAALFLRVPLKVDVVRDRGAIARMVAGERYENVYRLQIMNATEQGQRFRISAQGLQGIAVQPDAGVEVGPAESRWVPVSVTAPAAIVAPGSHPITFTIQGEQEAHHTVVEKSVFLVPR
jgi:cytochrome c oxidase accessory protein FixG